MAAVKIKILFSAGEVMENICTGVILAGGKSSRFDGRDKAFFNLGGEPLVRKVVDLFGQMFYETLIVTNNPVAHMRWNAWLCRDLLPVKSSLTGIHSGLFHARTPWIFVSACDTPFLRKSVVELVLSEIEEEIAGVMPYGPSGPEPLCAAYSKDLLPAAERNIIQGKLKIQRLFARRRVKKISVQRLRQADPELESFFNINTAEDLHKARSGLDMRLQADCPPSRKESNDGSKQADRKDKGAS